MIVNFDDWVYANKNPDSFLNKWITRYDYEKNLKIKETHKVNLKGLYRFNTLPVFQYNDPCLDSNFIVYIESGVYYFKNEQDCMLWRLKYNI